MDLFATKGVEYLLVIGYLVLLVPFAGLLARQTRDWGTASQADTTRPETDAN